MTTVLLLLLLAIALIITVAGLLLSSRHQTPDTREVYYAGRGVRRAGPSRQTRNYRSQVRYEQRIWTNAVSVLNIGYIFRRRVGEPTPWLGVLLVLLALFVFSFYGFTHLTSNSPIVMAQTWPDVAAASPPPTKSANAKTAVTNFTTGLIGASKALVRIGQLNTDQYSSMQDYNTWAYSACSAAAMTEVINSYGHNYRIADILKVEAGLGEITPDQGLMEDVGIQRTAAKFGFSTTWLSNVSVDTIVNIANHGHPIIIDFPPAHWSGGHILVVRGGDQNSVYLADSSRLNMQVMARDRFLYYWGGLSAVITPN